MSFFVLVPIFVVAFSGLEKVPALARRKETWVLAALLTELLFFLVYNTPFYFAFTDSIVRWTGTHLGFSLFPRFSGAVSPLLFTAQFAFCCLTIDFAVWFGHYAAHRWQPFSAFHKVHHSITDVNCLNFTHLHVCDVWCRIFLTNAPLFLICLYTPVSVYAFVYAKASFWIYGYFIHTSVNLPWLERQRFFTRVFVTPAYHRVHHRRDLVGKNLAIVFVFWDKLARIHVEPGPLSETLDYGLNGGESETYPRGFFLQHLEAFREIFRAAAR